MGIDGVQFEKGGVPVDANDGHSLLKSLLAHFRADESADRRVPMDHMIIEMFTPMSSTMKGRDACVFAHVWWLYMGLTRYLRAQPPSRAWCSAHANSGSNFSNVCPGTSKGRVARQRDCVDTQIGSHREGATWQRCVTAGRCAADRNEAPTWRCAFLPAVEVAADAARETPTEALIAVLIVVLIVVSQQLFRDFCSNS
eukprot:277371-Pyramimonas_sp.AAC.1